MGARGGWVGSGGIPPGPVFIFKQCSKQFPKRISAGHVPAYVDYSIASHIPLGLCSLSEQAGRGRLDEATHRAAVEPSFTAVMYYFVFDFIACPCVV